MEKYEQREVLGHGNSTVYRAIRLSDGASVALKRIKGWGTLDAAEQEKGLREVVVLKTVSHPHAIQLLDSFTDQGDLCMVMPQVCPGSRVFEAAALPLEPAAVARVGYQLVSALAHLHSREPQLLHRDIKPANLLLEAAPGAALAPPGPLTPAQASALVLDGTLILSDFGSALALHATNAVGTRAGTDAYKSPEVLDLADYDASADVWACGATLLQLATGHLAGRFIVAQRNLKGKQWTLERALAGEYHDDSSRAEDAEAWSMACAAQRAAWSALGAPMRSVIEACLVTQASGRATAAELLAHPAFAAQRLCPSGVLTPEALLHIVGTASSVAPSDLYNEAAFVAACARAEGALVRSKDAEVGGVVTALIDALGGSARVAAAMRVIQALVDGGSPAASAAARAGGLGGLLDAAAVRISAAEAEAQRLVAEARSAAAQELAAAGDMGATLDCLFKGRHAAEISMLATTAAGDVFTRHKDLLDAEVAVAQARKDLATQRAAFVMKYAELVGPDESVAAAAADAAEAGAAGQLRLEKEYALAFAMGEAECGRREAAVQANSARLLCERGEAVAALLEGAGILGTAAAGAACGVGGGGGGGGASARYSPAGLTAKLSGETAAQAVGRHSAALATLSANFSWRIGVAKEEAYASVRSKTVLQSCVRCGGLGYIYLRDGHSRLFCCGRQDSFGSYPPAQSAPLTVYHSRVWTNGLHTDSPGVVYSLTASASTRDC